VRVAQSFSGKWGGSWTLPRVGDEVLVAFVDGDPDRPVVIGSVYNAEQKPIYALPANKTQSGFKTKSSKGGGASNFNELRFEDKKGSEEIHVQAEKDMTLLIKNDRTETVKRHRTETVDGKHTETTKLDRTATITEGNESLTVKMGNMDTLVKTGNITTKASLGKIEIEAMQSITLKVGASKIPHDAHQHRHRIRHDHGEGIGDAEHPGAHGHAQGGWDHDHQGRPRADQLR
jgi:type VI secretion system secreted protein VgrG